MGKLGRIQRLQPLISSGALRFSRRQVTLLEQLRQFPMGAHDDGPDALENRGGQGDKGTDRRDPRMSFSCHRFEIAAPSAPGRG